MPQFAGSVASVAQPPAQSVVPDPQVVPQTPPEQTVPAAQARPHTPQLALSLRRLRSQPFDATPSQSPKPAAHMKRHAPAEHVPASAWGPAAHARPHIPQFATSVMRLRHVPEHVVCPVGHAATHTPFVQVCPAAQGLSQRPQCAVEVLVLVSQPLLKLPSHSPKPVLHVPAQRPAEHVTVELAGIGQTDPHAPQLFVSFVRLRHTPEQSVCPAAHVSVHAPPVQTCPVGQALPQRPQWAVSVAVLVQVPLQLSGVDPAQAQVPEASHTPPAGEAQVPDVRGVALHAVPVPAQTVVPVVAQVLVPMDVQLAPIVRQVPPQLVCPEGHAPPAHRLAAQDALPPTGAVQRLLHAPQLAVSFVVSVSQPFVGSRSQSPRPAALVKPQRPAEHQRVALGRIGQTVAQVPQWSGSYWRSVHAPPQCCCVLGHAATQRPFEHAEPVGQAIPHAPQLAGSLWVLASQPSVARPLQSA
jgi:hypothetical protein